MFEKKITDEEKKKLEKEEKKRAKEQKKLEKSEQKGGNFVKGILVPLLLTIAVVFALSFVLRSNAENEEVKGSVLVAKEEIAANTLVTKEDAGTYFTEASADLALIPDGAFESVSDLPDSFYVEEDLYANEIVMEKDLKEKDAVMDKYKTCLRTSISVDSFDNAVSGTLRKGDIVDIYALDPATEELVKMAGNVYIENAYDSAGNLLTGDGVACVFTILVTESEVAKVNEAILYGNIQLYLTEE